VGADKLLALLKSPSKEMVAAGQDAMDACIDYGYDSDADGNRHDYTTISSDCPAQVFAAMVAVALRQSEGAGA
jgi:hypothetical protein